MTIQDAYNFLDTIKTEAKRKQEIKVYKRFLHILAELNKKEFSIEETLSIEAKLDSLDLKSNSENRKKHISKALRQFEKYLHEHFSLISPDYYISLGIALGTSFGAALGVVFMTSLDNPAGISIGVAVGTGVGIAIGHSMDAKAKAVQKVL